MGFNSRKNQALLCFSLILIFLNLSGCQRKNNITVIKLGHGLSPTHSVHLAMGFMADYVWEHSHGRLKIEIYPSEQLGSERECLELLQIGSVGMTKVSCSVLEGFVPAMSVLSLPYIFRDEEHKFKVLEGEIGKKLLREGERFWLRGLCYYDAGSRSFYTKHIPIFTPADLEGMKIRTQESSTSMKMVSAMGGSPTPISWGELYSSLQQGVVEGAENNPPSFYLSRHYEVCKFYSLDEHTAVPDVLLISTKVWQTLSEQDQNLLEEAASASSQYQKKLWKESTLLALREVEKAGIKIIYPDKSQFKAKVQGIFDEYKSQPALYKIIEDILAVK